MPSASSVKIHFHISDLDIYLSLKGVFFHHHWCISLSLCSSAFSETAKIAFAENTKWMTFCGFLRKLDEGLINHERKLKRTVVKLLQKRGYFLHYNGKTHNFIHRTRTCLYVHSHNRLLYVKSRWSKTKTKFGKNKINANEFQNVYQLSNYEFDV